MNAKRLSVSLVVLLGLILVACGGGGEAGGSGGPIQVTTQNLRFKPDKLTVKAGQTVTVDITNEDSVPHTFEIEGVEGVGIGIPPGNEATVEFTGGVPPTTSLAPIPFSAVWGTTALRGWSVN